MDMKLKFLAVFVYAAFTISPSLACEGETCANGLAYEAFGPLKGATTLAVFVHGDVSSGGPADYMYSYAKSFAASHKNVVAVALLRPGYYDKAGKRSDGSDNGRRDTFHGSNNRAVAGAIQELKQKFGLRKVIGLGHSGGAGTLGVIAGNDAEKLNGVVLVSCPCDAAAWRASRGRTSGSYVQSPIDYISGISSSTPIVAVTGSQDDNTRPELAQDYVAKAKERGLSASVIIVNGAGHNFGGGLSGAAISALSRMAR